LLGGTMFFFRLPRGIGFGFALLVGLATTIAQTTPAPRPLTHADFDSWPSVATPQLSRD